MQKVYSLQLGPGSVITGKNICWWGHLAQTFQSLRLATQWAKSSQNS